MKIGILKADSVRPSLAGEYGEYPDMFMALLLRADPQLRFSVYDVQHGEYPRQLDEVDAYLMTGSKASVYEDQAWIHELADFVRRLHGAEKKMLGICFGHQMIAHALGGKTEKAEKGWGVGRHTYTLTGAAGAFGTPGTPFSVLVSHQDQVADIPPGAVILASSDFCPVAMMQVDGHMLSLQGHPEFCPGYARALMEIRRECIGSARVEQGLQSLAMPLDRDQLAGWLVDFLRR